jgi:hypothetical protein
MVKDLLGVIILRLLGAHHLSRIVAVAARTEIAGDHHRRARRLVLVTDLDHEVDGLAIGFRECGLRVADLRRPIRIGAPGRALQHEAETTSFRGGRKALVVVAQPL